MHSYWEMLVMGIKITHLDWLDGSSGYSEAFNGTTDNFSKNTTCIPRVAENSTKYVGGFRKLWLPQGLMSIVFFAFISNMQPTCFAC